MDILWKGYLDQLCDLDTITNLTIYTDQYRYWLVSGLLDLAEKLEWTISLQLIEEITDEEGMEIRQGLGFLPSTTLLVVFFSDRNPVINELLSIFPLLTSPFGFVGKSIIGQLNLPNQYFPLHLKTDLFEAASTEEYYRKILTGELTITDENSTYFEIEIMSIASYPYVNNSHVILPATEIIANINPTSLNGTISVSEAIGAFEEQDELVDPFGILNNKIELLVEEGKIIDIQGDEMTRRRLKKLITLPFTTQTIQCSFGLSQNNNTTGFIDHDRLNRRVMTLSWIDDNYLLEFVIGSVTIKQ